MQERLGDSQPALSPTALMHAAILNHHETTRESGVKWDWPLRKRILLVEDQPTVRQAIHLLLSLDHHAVTEATDGVEALELFKRDCFDVVITDLEMPRMKGNQLALKIKQAVPSQPVLMITAYIEQVPHAGNPADAILIKPFDLSELRDTLDRLLSGGGSDRG